MSAGSVAYVIGGYDGTRWDPRVLATRDGRHFRVAARLPVPVRYAAVAAAAGEIWVFGGQTQSGATNAIQRISPATGQATVAGHLPAPVRARRRSSWAGRSTSRAGWPRARPARSSTASTRPRPR